MHNGKVALKLEQGKHSDAALFSLLFIVHGASYIDSTWKCKLMDISLHKPSNTATLVCEIENNYKDNEKNCIFKLEDTYFEKKALHNSFFSFQQNICMS